MKLLSANKANDRLYFIISEYTLTFYPLCTLAYLSVPRFGLI